MDLTETRDYGSRWRRGWAEWSGFGQTLFVRPMEQARQQVLTPAAESLNAQWRSAVVEDWNSAFGGRYPFKNTSSEVSAAAGKIPRQRDRAHRPLSADPAERRAA